MSDFYEGFYLANNSDVARAVNEGSFGTGWEHYSLVGQDEGRSFAEPDGYGGFNELFYLANNPDVAKAVELGVFGTGWQHFSLLGQDEGRSFAEPAGYGDFNELFYLSNNADVAKAVNDGTFGTGWEHFTLFGQAEGRSFAEPAGYGDFNEIFYLANNPDVAKAVQQGVHGTGWEHFQLFGEDEGRSFAQPAAVGEANLQSEVLPAPGEGSPIPGETFILTEIPSQTETTLLVGDNGITVDLALEFLQDIAELDLTALGLLDEDGNLTSDIASINIQDNTDGTAQVIINADGEFIEDYFAGHLGLLSNVLFSGYLDTEETTTQTGIVLTPSENNGGAFEPGVTTAADDTIIAGRPELLQGAFIDGGAGYNTLVVDMKGFFAQPFQLRNIQEVQVQNLTNVYEPGQTFIDGAVTNFPIPTAATLSGDDSILDLSRASSLQKLMITEGFNAGGTLVISGIQNYATARLEGNFDGDVDLFYGGGQGNLLTVELANVSFHGTFSANQNVGAVELVSEGRVNTLDNIDFGGNFIELMVSGTGLLSIEDDLQFGFGVAYIDASENTGGVRMAVDTQLGFGALEEVTIMGSQGRDVFDINSAAQAGVLLNIDTGTGRDTVKLNEDMSAGEGSVITGENLTVQVMANADLRQADVSGVNSFVLSAAGGLLLTQEQVGELGVGVFSAAHNAIPVLSIEVSEAGTVLSDLIDLSALDSDVKLAFNVEAGASLDLTAEELHTYLADDGVVGEGTVTVTGAGLGFDADDPAATGIGDGVGSIDNDFEGTLHVVRAADGFERPVAAPDSDTLVIDTTDTGGVTVGANDLEGIADNVGAFSTAAETVIIQGADDITFDVPVEMLTADFTLDFSGLTGALNDLTIEQFNNVGEVIGNGAEGLRIDVVLNGDVGTEGADSGLQSSGVEQYVVVDIDDTADDDGDADDSTASFHLCDQTRDFQVIGLQGNGGHTLTLTNIPWGAVNPTILFEGDGYSNWDQLPKAAGNPDASNVGTIVAEYFFDGAPANVLINNQGVAPGLTSTGEARPIVVDGIVVDNAASLNIAVEDGDGVISSIADGGTGEGLADVTLTSANDVTLHLDGDDLDSIDATAVAGVATLQIGDDTDFSDTELSGIDAVVLEDGVTVTMTIDQITTIGTANITVENDGDAATLNVGNYDGQAFDFSALALDDITVSTVTFAEGGDITVDATTDFTGINELIIPADTTVQMSAEQYKQLVESEATITTVAAGVDDDEDGALTVVLDGDLTIDADATDEDGSDAFTINGSNVTFEMSDGETLNVDDFTLADGLQVTGDAAAAVKPLVNFTFENSGTVPFADTIDVSGYQDVDLRIFDTLLDDFYIDDSANGSFELGENSQSIEDLLENLDSANILNIFQEEADVELDPRDREVVVESLASPDGIEFSAEGELADFVRSIDLTLEADADNAASVEGDLLVNDGQVAAGSTMLTINAVDTDGAAVGPVTITGDIYSEGDDGAGEDGDLLTVTINAAVDVLIGDGEGAAGSGDGNLIFSSTEADAEATLTLTGAGDVTMKSVQAGTNVATVNIVTTGYTGVLTITGGSDAIEMGDDGTSLVFTGDADIVLDTDDVLGNNGIDGGEDLTSIDASEHSGGLTLSVIENVSETDFTFTAGEGTTTATLSATLDADPAAADPAEPGWELNTEANTTLTLLGSTFTSGALSITGEGTVVMDGDGGDVDLTGLVDADGNSLLEISADTTIELAPDTTLVMTPEQLDALNAAGITFTKQAVDPDADPAETEAEITVRIPADADLTAANEDLDADLDLSQADNLVLNGDATLTGTQVSGKTVTEAVASNLTLTGITAEHDLSGITISGTVTAVADAAATSISLAAIAISGVTLAVEGDALTNVVVTGVEAVVGDEGDADEDDVNADFSGLTATDLDVEFQLDSTGDVHLNGTTFAANVGTGSTTLTVNGTGTVTTEGTDGAELNVGAVSVGEDATLSVEAAEHNAGVGALVEGEGTVEVNDLGADVVTIDTSAAADTVDYMLTFTGDAGTSLVTITNFTANTADAQDMLNFSAVLPAEADHTLTKYDATIAPNQIGASDILVVSSALGSAVDAAAIEAAFGDTGAFTDDGDAGTDDTTIFSNQAEKIIIVDDDVAGDAEVWHWVDTLNGQIEAGELTQIAILGGTDTADLVAGNFDIA
ncbi:MAG: hypothetical protein U5S82_00645 [Gammaproteobacteria bacterium]|nr:hypothetical protein [Gammaproteobacteria bacterium]